MRLGLVSPMWPAAVRPAFRPHLLPPFISQLHPEGARPGFDGSASCGPTSFAMIARALGRRHESDAALIERLGRIGKTNLEEGTSLAGMEAMARSLDLEASIRSGADVRWLERAIDLGRFVIANGDYYAMPPHQDARRHEGHFVLVYGRQGERFLVHDPGDPNVKSVTRAQMGRFLREHHEGGHLISLAPRSDVIAARAG